MAADAVPPVAPPPAGAMHWHAWLYTPAAGRDCVAALFALESEWRSLVAPQVDHGVAHLKLQWWRDELSRLAAGEPRHPLTRLLAQVEPGAGAAWQALQDVLSALSLELANASYETEAQLDEYFALADGQCRALARLLGQGGVESELLAAARASGRSIRQVEVIRDLQQDAVSGRIHLPLAWLEEEGVTHLDLRSVDPGDGVRRCLRRLAERARRDWHDAEAGLDRLRLAPLRGLRVLGGLHARLLDRIEQGNFAVGAQRAALGPTTSLWTAWRAARQH